MNAETDHSEYEVPLIYIKPGWIAEDISTLDEYLDAYAYLMAACAEIEYKIEVEASENGASLHGATLRRALKYKKAALRIIDVRRGEISDKKSTKRRQDVVTSIFNIIRAEAPDKIDDWITRGTIAASLKGDEA